MSPLTHLDNRDAAMQQFADAVDAIHEQVTAAEMQARSEHVNGTCHLSEWSCSYCEATICGCPAMVLLPTAEPIREDGTTHGLTDCDPDEVGS